jgi:two-component sensor histidine kinase
MRSIVQNCLMAYVALKSRYVYSIAVSAVIAATLLRLSLHQELSTTAPFTTYSLAIILMSFAGGFWAGAVTLVLSVLAGSILFLPPAFSLTLAEGAGWTMTMFILFGTINVILISGLIAGILEHDDHQHFLIRELKHRSGNLFAVIQSIVSRTLAEGRTLKQAKADVETRLAALARTHAMLADSGWVGASLRAIVSEELASFVQQIKISGCDVEVNTPTAQNFALIVHELGTNAVKYGALSCSDGEVQIKGKINLEDGEELFHFSWRETRGPAVSAASRKGFGSTILYGMANRFGRTAKGTYAPDGFHYELTIPLAAMDVVQTEKTGIISSKPNAHGYPAPGRLQVAQLLDQPVLERLV